MLPQDLRDRHAGFALLENGDDLALREPGLPHGLLLSTWRKCSSGLGTGKLRDSDRRGPPSQDNALRWVQDQSRLMPLRCTSAARTTDSPQRRASVTSSVRALPTPRMPPGQSAAPKASPTPDASCSCTPIVPHTTAVSAARRRRTPGFSSTSPSARAGSASRVLRPVSSWRARSPASYGQSGAVSRGRPR
jgi:hypothetical protein